MTETCSSFSIFEGIEIGVKRKQITVLILTGYFSFIFLKQLLIKQEIVNENELSVHAIKKRKHDTD